MRAVNLLPRDAQVRSFEKNRGVAFGGVFGVAFVSVALSAALLLSAGGVRDKQATLDGLNAELAALPAPAPTTPAKGAEIESEKGKRLAAVSSALGGRLPWDRLLRRFSLVLPDDVWLTSLTARDAAAAASGSPPGAAAGATFTLSGSTYSPDGLARLLSRLAVVPDLGKVELMNANRQQIGQKSVVQFTIQGEIKKAGAA